jgi:aminoglycoside phosphotransferase (APT) family kinase protein
MREAQVLQALRHTSVPHAPLVATCADEDVLGAAVFYLMDAVDGFNPAEELPEGLNDYPARQRISIDATDALAAIGALDYVDIGLDGFGKPEGFLDRQVARWVGERDNYLALENYDGAPLPGYESIRDHLADNVPPAFRVGLMHGDYHLGNLLLEHQTADVAAVLDWEMSTVGDPLMDLGRYIAMWPDEHEVIVDTGGIWEAGPLPTPDTLVERYVQRSGAEVEHLQWYVVMGCFKLGIVLEGTYARSRAGLAPEQVGQLLHDASVRLFERACRLIGVAP